MQRQARADLGPADLLLLLEQESGLSSADVCRLLGYPVSRRKDAVADTKQAAGAESDTPALGSDSKAKPTPQAPVIGGYRPKFWQVLSLQPRETTEQAPEPVEPGAPTIGLSLQPHTQLREHPPLPSPVLLSQRALWSRASRAALCAAHAKRQELQHWLTWLSRAEVPSRPAIRQETQESGEIWLIMDYHPRLMPWWDEMNRVARILHQRFGKSRARLIPLLERDLSELRPDGSLPWPSGETRLLVFSDLGMLSGLQPLQQWQTVLQCWNQTGIQFSVFLPHSRPSQEIRRLANNRLELWDQTVQEPNKTQAVVEGLLACLAMVQWCSPALLRCWRRLLKGRVEHECRLWHHPKVWHQPGACGLHSGIDAARDRFAGFSQNLQQCLLEVKDRYRSKLSREVILEEALIQQSMGLAVEAGLQEAAARLTLNLQSRSRLPQATQEWLWRLSDRQCQRFWEENPQLEQLCIASRRQLARHDPAPPLGPGMRLNRQPSEGTGRSLSVRVVGERLRLAQVETTSQSAAGLELLRIEAGADDLECDFVTPGMNAGLPARIWRAGTELPFWGGYFPQLELVSDRRIARLGQLEKPAWAVGMEQGPEGLYTTLAEGRRLRWCYPEEHKLREMDPLTASSGTEQAAWVCERQWLGEFDDWQLTAGDSIMPRGLDRYGRYHDLVIGKQHLRLRWIPPGEFQMGSPEDEPERDDNERRHRVILTRGFWLAETACTQALWSELMGNNPSRFKGEELPVEKVSWEDVQAFITKLNQYWPELQVRLPSEAEWEYACRVGSEMAFWWGNELTTELANYNGNNPYHNGPKGEYREKTLPVKQFEPNPWGLYQMHGNVNEWCEDWYGAYPEQEIQVDPVGPERGAHRVFRGGFWGDYCRRLRAASRDYWVPGYRFHDLGFRLAAGPSPGGENVAKAVGKAAGKSVAEGISNAGNSS